MPYSVSPLRIDHSLGPKPKKYSVTFIPAHLAVMKWPVSWIMTMAMMARTKATTGKVPAAIDQTMPRTTAAGDGDQLAQALVPGRGRGGVLGGLGAGPSVVVSVLWGSTATGWSPGVGGCLSG